MKPIILSILLLTTVTGIAQTKKQEFISAVGFNHDWKIIYTVKDDTIEISLPLQIHYIKIGKSVFGIIETSKDSATIIEGQIYYGKLHSSF